MQSVYLSRRVMPRVVGELEASFDLAVHDSEWPPAREEVLARSAGRGGLLVMANDPVDEELFDAAGPQLRIVANHAVGLENVVLAPHLGSATDGTREAMGMLCVKALRAVLLEGRCPENALNPEAWKAPA